MTGKEVVSTMRKHGITIERAAEIFSISKKRVREVRRAGTRNDVEAWEWGTWLPARAGA
jgi:hypothetical protein